MQQTKSKPYNPSYLVLKLMCISLIIYKFHFYSSVHIQGENPAASRLVCFRHYYILLPSFVIFLYFILIKQVVNVQVVYACH